MSEFRRWRDTDHLDRAIETAGGQEAFDISVTQMLDETRRGWRRQDQPAAVRGGQLC
jgi:hypothetical protein